MNNFIFTNFTLNVFVKEVNNQVLQTEVSLHLKKVIDIRNISMIKLRSFEP